MRSPVLVVAAFVTLIHCNVSEDSEQLTRQHGSDLISFGAQVRVSDAAPGSVIAAGGEVYIGAHVAGDVLVAGSDLELTGPFGADVYAAGGDVHVNGPIAASLRAAGGAIRLGPDAEVAGGTIIAGGEAEISGKLHDYLLVTAGSTRLNASVDGDVEVSGGTLEVGPGAVVHGTLTHHGSQPPVIAPGARLQEVQHVAPPAGPAWHDRAIAVSVWALSLAFIGALWFLLAPNAARRCVQNALESTALALLVGAALIVGMPVAALLSFLSVLGAPLGVMILVLYVFSLPLGYMVAGTALAQRVSTRWRPGQEPTALQRSLLLLVVLTVLVAVSSVPVLGWVSTFLLVSAGLGSMAIQIRQALTDRRWGKRAQGAPSRPSDPVPHGEALPGTGVRP